MDDLSQNRNQLYCLMVELALENSKPAIQATDNQGQAMDMQRTRNL